MLPLFLENLIFWYLHHKKVLDFLKTKRFFEAKPTRLIKMDENLTVFDMYSPVLPINYTYGGLGILAMVCNTFVLMVYMTKDGLRKHFILFVCMAMADWVNGLAFLMTGK